MIVTSVQIECSNQDSENAKTSLLSCLHKTRRESMSPAKKPDYVGLFCCPNGDFVCAETQM